MCQVLLLCRPGGGIDNKKFTDQGASKMIRAILIELDGPLFFICQRVGDGHG